MIAIDHEYIPEDAQGDLIPSRRPDVKKIYCEIIQMGACKLDNDGNELGILSLTILPNKIGRIPEWLSKMTGMTDEKRGNGIPFQEAIKRLVDFIGDDKDIWTFSGDWWVLNSNCKANNIKFPFPNQFKKAKEELSKYDITLNDYKIAGFDEICSGGLYKVLEIELPEIDGVGAHDAAHDARSLAHSLFKLQSK